jgi:hypothetical protein
MNPWRIACQGSCQGAGTMMQCHSRPLVPKLCQNPCRPLQVLTCAMGDRRIQVVTSTEACPQRYTACDTCELRAGNRVPTMLRHAHHGRLNLCSICAWHHPASA